MTTRVQKLKEATITSKRLVDRGTFSAVAEVNYTGDLVICREFAANGFTLTESEALALYTFIQENYIEEV
jgi:hypothetical protein